MNQCQGQGQGTANRTPGKACRRRTTTRTTTITTTRSTYTARSSTSSTCRDSDDHTLPPPTLASDSPTPSGSAGSNMAPPPPRVQYASQGPDVVSRTRSLTWFLYIYIEVHCGSAWYSQIQSKKFSRAS